jgi:purine-binding chemotaxis protein CheW
VDFEMKEKYLHFTVDSIHLLIPIHYVLQVVPIVFIEDLPGVPSVIQGIIQYQDDVFPVYNLRKRFLLMERSPQISDELILLQTNSNPVALWVDKCLELLDISDEELIPVPELASTKYIKAMVRTDGEIFLIQDVDQFLEESEAIQLQSLIHDIHPLTP